ncbi:hypothetical protein ACLKA7_007417 [Drosophila subpalustris]
MIEMTSTMKPAADCSVNCCISKIISDCIEQLWFPLRLSMFLVDDEDQEERQETARLCMRQAAEAHRTRHPQDAACSIALSMDPSLVQPAKYCRLQ